MDKKANCLIKRSFFVFMSVFMLVENLQANTGNVSAGEQRDGFEYGLVAIQGDRSRMEDAHTVALPITGQEGSGLFAVFDGHGTQPEAIANTFPRYFQDYLRENRASAALEKSFEQMHEDMTHGGTTALAAYVEPISESENRNLLFANAGDSRGVLCSSDGHVIMDTMDDTPEDNPIERIRVENLGAILVDEALPGKDPLTEKESSRTRIETDIPSCPKCSAPCQPLCTEHGIACGKTDEPRCPICKDRCHLYCPKHHAYCLRGQVMTRSLGDKTFREEYRKSLGNELLLATPEIYTNQLQPDNFVILACDGLWDTVTSAKAAKVASECFDMESTKAKAIASSLETALGMVEGDRGRTFFPSLQEGKNRALLATARLVALAQMNWEKMAETEKEPLGDNISVLVFRTTSPRNIFPTQMPSPIPPSAQLTPQLTISAPPIHNQPEGLIPPSPLYSKSESETETEIFSPLSPLYSESEMETIIKPLPPYEK